MSMIDLTREEVTEKKMLLSETEKKALEFIEHFEKSHYYHDGLCVVEVGGEALEEYTFVQHDKNFFEKWFRQPHNTVSRRKISNLLIKNSSMKSFPLDRSVHIVALLASCYWTAYLSEYDFKSSTITVQKGKNFSDDYELIGVNNCAMIISKELLKRYYLEKSLRELVNEHLPKIANYSIEYRYLYYKLLLEMRKEEIKEDILMEEKTLKPPLTNEQFVLKYLNDFMKERDTDKIACLMRIEKEDVVLIFEDGKIDEPSLYQLCMNSLHGYLNSEDLLDVLYECDIRRIDVLPLEDVQLDALYKALMTTLYSETSEEETYTKIGNKNKIIFYNMFSRAKFLDTLERIKKKKEEEKLENPPLKEKGLMDYYEEYKNNPRPKMEVKKWSLENAPICHK